MRQWLSHAERRRVDATIARKAMEKDEDDCGMTGTHMRERARYYNLGGADGHTPVPVDDVLRWAAAMERRKAKDDPWRVARTELAKGVEVSTVFLGLDHAFTGDGPPILFETLVFGGPLDGEMDRYYTWAEAEAGHKAKCESVTVALGAAFVGVTE